MPPSADNSSMSLKRALTVWLVHARIGKAKSTQHYHREIIKAIRRLWKDRLTRLLGTLTEDGRTGAGVTELVPVTPGASRFLGSHVNLKLPDSPAVSHLAKITAVRRSVQDSGATVGFASPTAEASPLLSGIACGIEKWSLMSRRSIEKRDSVLRIPSILAAVFPPAAQSVVMLSIRAGLSQLLSAAIPVFSNSVLP